MAIPTANINASTTAEFVAVAVPIANPTESPSGILWIVIAEKSLKALELFEVLLEFVIIFAEIKSKSTIKNAPRRNPIAIGIKAQSLQYFFEYSREGASRDQKEADNITPDANPIVKRFKSFDSFLKKKISAAPRVVVRHGRVNDKMIATVLFISCKHPFFIKL